MIPNHKRKGFFIKDILDPSFGERRSQTVQKKNVQCEESKLNETSNNPIGTTGTSNDSIRITGTSNNSIGTTGTSNDSIRTTGTSNNSIRTTGTVSDSNETRHTEQENNIKYDNPVLENDVNKDLNIVKDVPWPSWIYCTRYSDRPSAGPRNKKERKKEKKVNEKRPRTAFTVDQLNRLQVEFEENKYLTDCKRRSLSSELDLNESQIKIWFQNKRAKLKKSTTSK